jgi:hypothetical protein
MLKIPLVFMVIVLIHYSTSNASLPEEALPKDEVPTTTIQELTSNKPEAAGGYLTKENAYWLGEKVLCVPPMILNGGIAVGAGLFALIMVGAALQQVATPNEVAASSKKDFSTSTLLMAICLGVAGVCAATATSFGYATKKLWTSPQQPSSTENKQG